MYIHTALLLVKPVSAITLANNALCWCFCFFFLNLFSLPCFITYTPTPSRTTTFSLTSRGQSLSLAHLSAVCHLHNLAGARHGLICYLFIVSAESLHLQTWSVQVIYTAGSKEKQGLLLKPWGHPGQPASVCSWFAGLWFVPNLLRLPPSLRKGSACEADGSSDRGDSHLPGQGAFGSQTSLRQP